MDLALPNIKKERREKTMHDLIIIGSGPAGLSAAVYAKRAGLDAIILEQSPVSGGQVLNTYEVDNYLGMPGINGFDMGMRFREHADKLGCQFVETTVDAFSKIEKKEKIELKAAVQESKPMYMVHTEDGDYETRTIIVASGASYAKLEIPGEAELTGMGVSYCATCDGAFFKGKTVAVVGGGDVAVEDAIFLARGCEKVYLIHRREELRAASILQKNLMELSNVEILWNTVVETIEGEEQVNNLKIKNLISGEINLLPLSGVFIAVGIKPNSSNFKESVPCDEQGYIIAGEDCASKIPGIYAVGDIRTKNLRQIITAVSDGANAITSIQHYLLNS